MKALLDDAELPAFAEVDATQVDAAIAELLADAEAALETTVADGREARYADLAASLDPAVERLQRAWSLVGHLHAVVDSPALREAYQRMLPQVVGFTTRLASDRRLYARMRAVQAGDDSLDDVQRKVVDDAVRDFVLGGAELEGAARQRHAAILARCAELSQRFGENLLDATDGWRLAVDPARLDGVPEDVCQHAIDAAGAAGRDGALLSLHAPCRLPVMRHAHDRALREQVHRAHTALCTREGAEPGHDNTAIVAELLALRQELAALLGEPSYAALSLRTKMAATPAKALAFVRELAGRAREQARHEARALERHATETLGYDRLQPWDRLYVAERLRQQLHAIGDEQLRPYFPLPRVLAGVVRLVKRLCGVDLQPLAHRCWHADASVLAVVAGQRVLGHLTLDLHARDGKQGGAWLDEARSRWRRPDGARRLQTPIAHLVCNFAPATDRQPALLSHDDVITLLHEFGHALHHLLTRVDEWPVAGIHGVEWDAAELPSQFMENYAWDWEVLHGFSAHVHTGEPLPRALFDRLSAARHFGAALAIARQAEQALFDLLAHDQAGPPADTAELALAARREIGIWTDTDGLGYPMSFGHLFDGGYAAGYYGYAWAEVLSADAFEAFEQAGLFDAATARRWCDEVLATGGSRSAAESFRAFRGRDPRIDAFLRHNGLVQTPPTSPSPV